MDLEKKVRELIAYPNERNWFEFKENWYEPNALENIFLLCPMQRH